MSPTLGTVQVVASLVSALLLPTYVGAFVAPGAAVRWATLADKGSTGISASSDATTPSAPMAATAEEAKKNLKDVLVDNRGSTLVADVVAAAEELAKFNPPSSNAKAWSLLSGEWISIGEDFSGTTRTSDGVECTLGRLGFNIFEPVTLPVLITEIRNTIGPRAEGSQPADLSFYNICTRWVARDGSGLKGQTEISGECWEDPSKPTQMLIRFSKGVVKPDETQDLEAWRKVIGVKDASQKKGPLTVMKEGAAKLLLKVAFGFKGPADSQGPGGELSYEMKRSPSGSHYILYLDDEMRVTRGMKGDLVVTTRS